MSLLRKHYITRSLIDLLVDYILFLTADVDVTPNFNEIRDYKYVDKEELQKMFDDPGRPKVVDTAYSSLLIYSISDYFHPVVQAHCS